ncbi:trehalose-phosphatase [Halanaerobium salsuginis]|jgi:trehalose 6-phosphate phosphatase|uniref:Trehalose 6-phosphate phosphatase n=1 Tax=Halanaerobium salsuginis TaxID=29563 RepID=A0A1I4I1C5_9FIRM|nr:trehalose-phosphatase [Halanaerobium salsuginis]SFL47631.1 trehalose 6-phosphate phosphatase [Halanaerobium salsuginis]
MNKKNLLELTQLAEVKDKITAADKVLLFLDYDGTLAPFKPDPAQAYPLPAALKQLEILQQLDKYTLNFVSGRKLSDLKKMLKLEGVNYAGSHGLEIDLTFAAEIIYPLAKQKIDQQSRKLYQNVKKNYEKKAGFRVEDKGFGLAIHLETTLNQDKIVTDLLQKFKSTKYQVLPGRKVIEIRLTGWDKGKTVEYIKDEIVARDKLSNYLIIYLGDDSTDEDVFCQLEQGITIYIKNESNLKTAAEYFLADPAAVADFLKELVET